MRVYVDKLPKDCMDCCPCESEYYCNLLHENVGCYKFQQTHKNCPLQSLAEHDKQVRKEMAEVIARLEKENVSLKNELIKECKEHQEAMQIADKRIKAYQNELTLYKRAFNAATLDLDLCKNHSQTLNDECVERFENLRNTILERIKEKMEG